MVCSYMVMAHVDSALQMLAIIKPLHVTYINAGSYEAMD